MNGSSPSTTAVDTSATVEVHQQTGRINLHQSFLNGISWYWSISWLLLALLLWTTSTSYIPVSGPGAQNNNPSFSRRMLSPSEIYLPTSSNFSAINLVFSHSQIPHSSFMEHLLLKSKARSLQACGTSEFFRTSNAKLRAGFSSFQVSEFLKTWFAYIAIKGNTLIYSSIDFF